MSKDSLLSFINHYKKSIEKNADNEERVLHCLQRLTKLRMDVNLLQQTGIGKTVANARKLDGEAGKLAQKLLHTWKEIVSNHENAEKKSSPKGEPLFKLPIKLDSDEKSEIEIALEKMSESSSEKKHSKSHHHHHHHTSSSSRHSNSSKDKERSKNSEKVSSNSTSSTSSSSSNHKSSHHSSHSSHNNSSSKRKRDESKDTNEKTHKKSRSDSETTHKKSKHDPEKHKESSKNRHDNESSKKKSKEKKKEEEIDGSAGLGFAEALAMFDMPSTSKKKDLHLADKVTIISPKKSSSSSKEHRRDKPSTSTMSSSSKLKELKVRPKLLDEMPSKLEPLPDIVKELPSDLTIPEYRPTPLSSAVKDYINSSIQGSSSSSLSRHAGKSMNEVMTESFASKVNRTRVFSGNRVKMSIPTLFDMCIRILQENIDFLTETGGVPFDILRPVLEKAKPDQLSTIEYYNPYLLEESDVLWEPHIKRQFRSRKREELESWREMYERCTREDEEKLSRLTKNIKKHQEIADSGVQKTRLAFVDSLVKPPRNVMRKQEIFGTNNKLVSSPAARTEGLRHLAPNVVLAGDVRLRVAAGLRDDAQISRNARPIKKAPMMAKLISKWKR